MFVLVFLWTTAGRAGPGAAALPVVYRVIPSCEGKGLLPMSVDLVPALRFTMWPRKLTTLLKKLPPKVAEGVEEAGLHVVPKPCLDGESNTPVMIFMVVSQCV